MKRAVTASLAVLLITAGASSATAAGSDAPTPYTVDDSGISLPAGELFVDGGHVNIRTTDGAGHGIHFEALNNQPSGEWIGASFIPWSAFGLDADCVCIEWVQLSQFNEHFGEGGQSPVGEGCGPTPTPSPSTTPSTTPTPNGTPSPSATPTANPTPTQTPTPSATPSSSPTVIVPGPHPEGTEGVGTTTITTLPDTGVNPWPAIALAALLATLGAALMRRGARP